METLKAILFLPVGALLYLPFVRIASRIMATKRLSFGAAFLLGLILGASMLAADLAVTPLVPGQVASLLVWVALSLAISTAVCGYFVTTLEGQSVGPLKGFYFTLLSQVLFAVAFFVIGGIVVGLGMLWSR